MSTIHKSVLYKEALEALAVKKGDDYIDATVNGGGHTSGILEFGGKVLGIDIDQQAVEHAAKSFSLALNRKSGYLCAGSESLTLVCGNFTNIGEIANKFGVWETSGVLFDLGLSSFQLDQAKRGFSFRKSGPLDMRLDPRLAVTAADLVNGLNEGELYELFNKYGEEPFSRRIARIIVKARVSKKIETTQELSGLIERAIGRSGKIHPATRVFQALRIAVNDELNNLKQGLEESLDLLKKDGRLVVISFHSLEDRVVKSFFKGRVGLRVLSEKPILPSRGEIFDNPRARSAKMRVAQKV